MDYHPEFGVVIGVVAENDRNCTLRGIAVRRHEFVARVFGICKSLGT